MASPSQISHASMQSSYALQRAGAFMDRELQWKLIEGMIARRSDMLAIIAEAEAMRNPGEVVAWQERLRTSEEGIVDWTNSVPRSA
jgi:hypothetical protein